MRIEVIIAYKIDGAIFESDREAKKYAETLFSNRLGALIDKKAKNTGRKDNLYEFLVSNKKELIDILKDYPEFVKSDDITMLGA